MARNKIVPQRSFRRPNDPNLITKNHPASDPPTNEPFFISTTSKTNTTRTNSDSGRKRDPFFARNKKKNLNEKTEFPQTKQIKNKTFNTGRIEKKKDKLEKRPFDKKKWRLQKYSKKYKLDQWEDNRKKTVLKEYYKEIKDDKPKLNVQKIYEEDSEDENKVELDQPQVRPKNYVRPPNYMPHESDDDDIEYFEDEEETAKNIKSQQNPKFKNTPYKKAKKEFQRLKQEKEAKKQELTKAKAEREEAMKEYKKKKTEKFKKLNQKTRKGQPLMKGRIEMLLEKIQSS